jgi:hypothetical protein
MCMNLSALIVVCVCQHGSIANMQPAATSLPYHIHVCKRKGVSFLLASLMPKTASFPTKGYTKHASFCQARFKYRQSFIKEMVSSNNGRENKR